MQEAHRLPGRCGPFRLQAGQKGETNMKSLTKRALCLCLSLILVFGLAACSAAGSKKAERLSLDARPDAPSEIPEGLDIDWNARYTFAELEA